MRLDADGDVGPVDVRIADGVVVEVGARLRSLGEPELEASGVWALPGLWDAHVHFTQWVRSTTWLDVAGTRSAAEVCARVGAAASQAPPGRVLVGFGYRSAPWSRPGTVGELDAVSAGRPVVLVAGDAHNGWLNSAALSLLGVPRRDDPLAENEWFDVFPRLGDLPGGEPTTTEVARAVDLLASRGLTGIVDLEFADAFLDWPARVAAGIGSLRVRAGCYEHQLDHVLRAGWTTGDALPGGAGLVTMGPLKIISDGSLGTGTAWCCEPYLDAGRGAASAHGSPNLSPADLTALVRRAHEAGLALAVHAIGDCANTAALDAFAATGASGTLEHAQLLADDDLPRFAELGVTASVQPAHLVDDRDTAEALWGQRTRRAFRLRSLLDAGARLAFGSDAPVSPPEPWVAMACAVHRSGDERPGWHPEESITPAQALASSIDGRRVAVGEPGDLVLVGHDPLAGEPDDVAAARRLRSTPVLATVCAGRVTYSGDGQWAPVVR